MRRNRLNNVAKPTVVDGITFDSKREAARYCDLKLLERAGEIRDLKVHQRIQLIGKQGPLLTTIGRPMHYEADFTYVTKGGAFVIEDVKGHETEVFKLKRAILAAQGITIAVVR